MEVAECLPEPRIDLALKMTTDYLKQNDLRALVVQQPGSDPSTETLLLVIHARTDLLDTIQTPLQTILQTLTDTP